MIQDRGRRSCRRDRLYQDQATVLSQLGIIDRSLAYANITEIGRFLRDSVERLNSFSTHDGTPCLTKRTENGRCRT